MFLLEDTICPYNESQQSPKNLITNFFLPNPQKTGSHTGWDGIKASK